MGKSVQFHITNLSEMLGRLGVDIAKARAASHGNQMFTRTLSDIVRVYSALRATSNESEYIQNIYRDVQKLAASNRVDDNVNLVQQLVFFDLIGFDTSWANFMVVEVMALEDFSAKRIAYTAAAILWTSATDAALMATNRISRDLTSINAHLTSAVLSSIPTYLCPALGTTLAPSVVSLMSSVHAKIRQKAITAFYHICLHSPECLKSGVQILRARLDDDDTSVSFSALTVIAELCAHNPANFVALIPKLHRMLENTRSNWVMLRVVVTLKLLCAAEPRLPKKLAPVLSTIIENTSSITVLFEVVRAIVEVPLSNTVLLTLAAERMGQFLEHRDANLRFLGLTLFMQLLRLQPRLVAQHRALITQCLDSEDDPTRFMALDLLASIATAKSIDGIVHKIFECFRGSRSPAFRNQLVTRVVEICSRADYAVVQDFDWYISVVLDFVAEGGLTCFDLLADQFLDLALRVPPTRPRLVAELGAFLARPAFREETKLLLTTSHVVGEYAPGEAAPMDAVTAGAVVELCERVQVSCLSAAFKIFLRAGERKAVGARLCENLRAFAASVHAEVQDIASVTATIVGILQEDGMEDALAELVERLSPRDDEDEADAEIPKPKDLDLPVDLFIPEKDELDPDLRDVNIIHLDMDYVPEAKKKKKRASRQAAVKERAVVLKREGVLRAKTPDVQKKSGALSNKLAKVDLTETVAAVEAQRAAPIRTDVSLQAKRKAEAEAAAAKQRKAKEEAVKPKRKMKVGNEKAKPKQPPVEGPLPGYRQQPLCEDASLSVNAVEFTPAAPNSLTVDLLLKNRTAQPIGPIQIIRVGTGDLRPIDSVPASGSLTTSLELSVDDPAVPKLVKLRFVCPGVDPLEGDLRVFPSFFLSEAPAEELAAGKEIAVYGDQLDLSAKGDGRAVLQLAVNILRGAILPGDERQSKIIFARSASGAAVVATVTVASERVLLTVKSSDETLAQILLKEIQRKK
jgi:hypothetical protein